MKNIILLALISHLPSACFATSLASEYESRGMSANEAIQQQINWGIEACMGVIQKRASRSRLRIVDSEVQGNRTSRGAFTNTVYAKLSNGVICSCVAEPDASSASCQ